MRRKKTIGGRIFDFFNKIFFVLVIIICILPIWHVVCASFSDASWVMAQTGVITRIKGFNLRIQACFSKLKKSGRGI